MVHYLAALGFRPREVLNIHPEDFVTISHPRYVMVSTFREASGVTINAAVHEATGYRSQTMGIVGEGQHRVAVTQLIPGVAVVEILGADDQVLQRVIAHVDDPHMYGGHTTGDVYSRTVFSDYRLGGVAIRVQRGLDEGVHAGFSQFTGSRYLLTPKLFRDPACEQELQADYELSKFAMQITALEERTNQLTGRSWMWVQGDVGLANGHPLALALNMEDAADLQIGDTISGDVYLCGSTGLWDVGMASPQCSHMQRGTNTFLVQMFRLQSADRVFDFPGA